MFFNKELLSDSYKKTDSSGDHNFLKLDLEINSEGIELFAKRNYRGETLCNKSPYKIKQAANNY